MKDNKSPAQRPNRVQLGDAPTAVHFDLVGLVAGKAERELRHDGSPKCAVQVEQQRIQQLVILRRNSY